MGLEAGVTVKPRHDLGMLVRAFGCPRAFVASQKQKSACRWSAMRNPSPTTTAHCSVASDVDLFCDLDGIIDLDAGVADIAFDSGMPKQELHRT